MSGSMLSWLPSKIEPYSAMLQRRPPVADKCGRKRTSEGDGYPQRSQKERPVGLATMGSEGVVIFELCHGYAWGCRGELFLSRADNAALFTS